MDYLPYQLQKRSHRGPLFVFLSLLIASLIASWLLPLGRAGAEVVAAPPKMQVRAGFDSYYKQISWLPVQINLSLPEGNPNFDGWLEASFSNFAENSLRYRRNVQLAAPANRTVWLYLPTDQRNLQEVQVRLSSRDGAELETQNIALRSLSENEFLLGVISEDSASLSYLNGQQLSLPFNRGSALLAAPRYTSSRTYAGSGTKPTLRVAHLTPADLPPEASGWDSLDGLALSDLSTYNLSDQSFNQDSLGQAASTWLAQGHLLFVAGDSALRRSGFLADLLAVKTAGPPQTGVFPSELDSISGASLSAAGNVLIANSFLLPGATNLADQKGNPLLAKRPFGLGTSWFMGTDLRALPTSNGLQLWRYTLKDYEPRQSYSANFRQPTDAYRRWFSEVSPIAKIATLPDITIIMLVLFAYVIVIGPAAYFGLKQLGKREWGWVVVPAIALGFSLAIYLIGAVTSGDPLSVSRLSVITVGENSNGKMEGGTYSVATVYSNKRVEFRLTTTEQAITLAFSRNRYEGFGRTPNNIDEQNTVVQQGPGGGYGQILMGLSDQRSFAAEQSNTGGVGEGIIARLRAKGDELEGTLENRTGQDWVDLGIWKPGSKLYNIPLLKAGEKLVLNPSYQNRQTGILSRNLAGAASNGLTTFNYNPGREKETYTEQKAAVLSTLVGAEGEALPKSNERVYLVAWKQTTTNFPLKIENSSVTTNDLTLLFEPLVLL